MYKAGFTPDLKRRVQEYVGEGKDIDEHFGFMRMTEMGLNRPEDIPAPDYSPYWRDEDLPEGTTISGMGVAEVPSGFYHFTGYISPLRNATSLSEIENYPLDDMSDWDSSFMPDVVAEAHAEGKVASGYVGHMYETAWQIRGYEQFLMDMIERPAWAECLLERIAEQNMAKARACARAGVDMIRFGDDVANQNAMMFSPKMWYEMHHKRWAKIWAEIKSISPKTRIWYHSDGNVEVIVDQMMDSGLDILNPLQPECLDIDAIYERFGDRLTFDGCMGTQSTMPWGSADDVKARVKELIDKYGQNGGLIISPTHVLEPEVPIENIQALADACRQYGTFE